MEHLREILQKYSRWRDYDIYISRIESQREIDFSICIENSKALIEGIAKEICSLKNQDLNGTESMNRILSLAFGCLGYPPNNIIRQVGSSLANIGHQIGVFRNEIGNISHGRTAEELRARNESLNSFTAEFLFSSTALICSFLIEAFESEYPLRLMEQRLEYDEQEEFNQYWDELYGEFQMGMYSFFASEILFKCEPQSYKLVLDEFNQMPNENNN